MKKRGFVVCLIILLFLMPLVLSASVEDEIKKITHYAEEYETGNINYVQLLIYTSAVKQNLNEILGATEKQMGGVLKQAKIKEILGEPSEETKWVWAEGEEQDKKLDSPVPVWKKIVFDGKKIQIRLEAFPSIFTKKQFDEGNKKDEEIKEESNEGAVKEGDLIYRLNFWIEFKKPEEQLNIQSKINEIKSLAESFNSDPSQANAEILAKESVNAERTFESYFRQNQGKCEDLMASIFGSESQMPNQNMIVQEISFYEGEKFEIIARLEMCDDCEGNWINLDLWVDMRGPMPKIEEGEEMISPEQFKNKDNEYYKSEIISLLDSYKKAAEEENWKEISKIKQKIWVINDAWNQKANDVWKEIEQQKDVQGRVVVEDKISEEDNQNNVVVENREDSDTNDNNIVENTITGNFITSITGNVINEGQSPEQQDPYYWIKQDQERRKQEKELRKKNYEERKQFYLSLFSGYDKKEYSFAQIEFKKRLIELFKEKGEEICNNNQDDNQNEKVDCDDEQCGGKICGKGINSVIEGNETKEVEVDFYCIAGECKAKEERIEVKEIICGDHICEGNETIDSCSEDCSLCQEHSAINCSGKVIFKGKDENNCLLEPICIEEKPCSVNEDCKFLCGDGECIEGKCKVKELRACEEAQCVAGDKKILNCQTGEQVVVEECIDGLWIKTGIECEIREENRTEENCNSYCLTQPRLMCEGNLEISGNYPDCNCNWVCQAEDIVGDECVTREDCGSENDVCSNGRCVSIPEVIPTEPEVEQPEIEQPEQTQPSEQPEIEQPEPVGESAPDQEIPTTGQVIFAFFRTLLSRARIIGAAITGFEVEGEGESVTQEAQQSTPLEDTSQQEITRPEPNQENQQPPLQDGQQNQPQEQQMPQDNQQPMENFEDNRDDEMREENERRKEEQKERCSKDCNRPCIEKCIRENCGEEMDCNIDEESKKCETSCVAEDACIEKCIKGEGEWWKEFENKEEFKEQKGVFESGGSCRTAKGKTEGFIWFGGWGDPFQRIQPIKNKYYSGGNADWCKFELQNLIKQRGEFEKGFNQEFAKWFFEEYLANSAENWEQAVSGIFELYWNNVDNQRQIAERMKCLGINNINKIMNYNLIEIKYDTEYGSLEYWEEVKEVEIPGLEGKFTIISPYMKIWIFPSETFMKYEMKQSMKNHEFPGSPEDRMERKNEEGMTAEEKEMIKQDKKFMEKIKAVSQKYDGNLDVVIQLKDDSTGEVLFNLYVQVNENDILKMKPMLPEENPSEDVKVEIPFSKIYDLIYTQEKEMRGVQTESPPWDKKIQPMQKIKEVVNGVKMYFKVSSIMNSAKFTPEESESEMKSLFKSFFSMTKKAERGGAGEPPSEEEIEKMKKEGEGKEGKEIWESKEVITGEIIKE